jgi:hypothetical protein
MKTRSEGVRTLMWCVLVGLVGTCQPGTCAEEARFDMGVAAEVTRGAAAAQTAGALRENQQLSTEYQNIALEQAVAQEGATRGLTERLDVQHALLQARRQVMVQAVREDLARTLALPPEKDVQAEYQKDPKRWTLPEAFQLDVYAVGAADTNLTNLARSLVTGKPVADDALAGLKAQQLVSQASGRWMSSGDVASSIWTNLAAMKQGEARLFDADAGYVLVRRGGHRDSKVPKFEEVQMSIQGVIMRQKEEASWNTYLAKKRKELGF